MNESGQNFRRRLRICFLFWQRTVQINFSSCGQSALSWAVCYFTVFLLSRSAKLICYNCRIENEAHDNGLSKAPCVPYYEEYQTAKISIICSEPPKADDGDPASRLAGELYDGNNPRGNGFRDKIGNHTTMLHAAAGFWQKTKSTWSMINPSFSICIYTLKIIAICTWLSRSSTNLWILKQTSLSSVAKYKDQTGSLLLFALGCATTRIGRRFFASYDKVSFEL